MQFEASNRPPFVGGYGLVNVLTVYVSYLPVLAGRWICNVVFRNP